MTTHLHEKATETTDSDHTAYAALSPTTRPGRIRRAAPWLAGLWVAAYVPMAILHLTRGTNPPWPHSPASALASLTEGQVSGLIVALGSLAAVALAAVLLSRNGARSRVGGGALVAVGLVVMLVIADTRALSFVGYGPMLLLGLLGVGPVASGSVEPAILLGSGLALGSTLGGIGMLLTGGAAVVQPGSSPWASPARTRRIGSWAVAVAVASPLVYAVTRVAWTLGLPLGVREEFLGELGSAKWAGFGLGMFAAVGALLTLGLVQRWGEVFWSWVPVIGGRPVPVGMAVVPALFVAVIITSGGVSFWGAFLSGHLSLLPGSEQDWATWVPELLWPAWGLALAVAALAYRHRRQSAA